VTHSQLGMGVMLGILGGNKETVESVQASIGKTIANIVLENDKLEMSFTDGTKLTMWDDGQSCCETRYMMTDDTLSDYIGATVHDFELKDAPNEPDEYGDHEVQFLDVKTSKGTFQMATHNEHNGYYGGFYIVAKLTNHS